MTQAPDDASGVSNRSSAVEFLAALFNNSDEESDGQVYLSSLPNERDDPLEPIGERHVCPPSGEAVDRFIHRYDRPRRGLFVCVGTVADNTRNKDNVRETVCLHCDVDFKNLASDEPTIRAALDALPTPPSIVVRSGNGLHLYWLLREPIDTQQRLDRIEAALRKLMDVVGGDPAVCHVAALMRLPGTHNTKKGDFREVMIERLDAEVRYELEDLEDWLDAQRPVLSRKGPSEQIENGGANAVFQIPEQTGNDNPYLKHAQEWGYKPRLDVEQRLAEMAEGNIHVTLRDVSASLIHAGEPFEEVVCYLMEAARQVGGPDWNWRAEEKKIRDLCTSAQKKFPPKQPEPPPDDSNVVDLGEARIRTKPKSKPRGPNALLAPFVVANGVIETVRRHGADILLSEGEVWLYGDGFWRIMTSADQQWLVTMIQHGFETLGEPGKTSSLMSAWKRITEHPGLFKAKVPWAGSGAVMCRNGVMHSNREIEMKFVFKPHSPDNYARRCLNADYIEGALCPLFERLIASMFADQPDGPVIIGLVQEWLGAALMVSSLSREERRALILVGPSRTGKTELARIVRLLLGGPIATPSVPEISDKFGLGSLYGAVAWIRDDAINEGDKLDPQRFKTIVTGEPVDVQPKWKGIISNVCFEIPILLTCNTLPRARDNSDAIFNRSIILPMTNVIDEATAVSLRLTPGISIGTSVFEAEASGILNWALAGLLRLRARGRYDIPPSLVIELQRFKDENNPVGEWAREALVADPWSKVERRDLVRAYNGWELELEGDEARAHGGRWLLPRLRSQVKGLGDLQVHSGARYITGVKLTKVGLNLWESYGKASPRNGPGGFALTAVDVNQVGDKDHRGMRKEHEFDAIKDTF